MITDNKERLKRRMLKLHNLAMRGVGGEKETAERMLNKMLAKHDIKLADILDDAIEMRWFKHKRGKVHVSLFQQIVFAVHPESDGVYKNKHRRYHLGFECTSYQASQIIMQYSVYSTELDKDLDRTFAAFIRANEIFPSDPKFHRAPTEPSEEEKVNNRKIAAMAQAIKKTHIREGIGHDG